jgi:two-component system sensor histidine kinase ChiS
VMKKSFLMIVFLFCWIYPVFSDALIKKEQHSIKNEYLFQRIPPHTLLQGAIITDIYKDRTGFIWIATYEGLLRYDGCDIIKYEHDPFDKNSLSNNYIENIVEDEQGFLWLSTRNGLDCFDPKNKTFTHYIHDETNADSISDNWINFICMDDENNLWIGTRKGVLDYFDRTSKRFKHYTMNTKKSYPIYTMEFDQQGNLLLGMKSISKLIRFNTTQETFEEIQLVEPGSPRFDTICIEIDKQGVVWIGTWKAGLFRYDPQSNQVEQFVEDVEKKNQYPHFLKNSIIREIHIDENGLMWLLVLNEGITLFDYATKEFKHIQAESGIEKGLVSNGLSAICGDNTGLIWFGSLHEGICFYSPYSILFNYWKSNPDDPHSLRSDDIFSIISDRDGKIWIGARKGGLSVYDPLTQTFTNYKHNPDDPTSILDRLIIGRLYEDKQGKIWICYWSGQPALDVYHPETNTFHRVEKSQSGNEYSCDSRGS